MKNKFIIFLIFVFMSNINISSAISMEVNVPAKYKEVIAGERVYFDVSLEYPENPNRKDLNLEYEIQNLEGIVAKSNVVKSIETKASYSDFIVIPATTKEGDCDLNVLALSQELKSMQESTNFFVIGKEMKEETKYLFILAGAVGVLFIVVMAQFVYIYSKKK